MSAKVVLVDNGFPTAQSETQFVYNLLPVGRFYDKRYGEIWVTRDMIEKMVGNFGKYPSYEVPVKLGHGDGAASPGRVIAVAAKEAGLEITMVVDIETASAINNKQYRYMSAEYESDYIDKKTGEQVGPVLVGAALVNQPADPYVEPLVLAEDIDIKGGSSGNTNPENTDPENIDPEKTNSGGGDMSEEAKNAAAAEKLLELQKKLDEANAKLAENEKAFSDLQSANKSLMTEKLNAEVKAFCDDWSAKGIPPAALEKVKSLLLSENRTIKLSDGNDKSFITYFGELFDLLPKVPMGQMSKTKAAEVELTDVQKAVKLGADIASLVNKKKEA